PAPSPGPPVRTPSSAFPKRHRTAAPFRRSRLPPASRSPDSTPPRRYRHCNPCTKPRDCPTPLRQHSLPTPRPPPRSPAPPARATPGYDLRAAMPPYCCSSFCWCAVSRATFIFVGRSIRLTCAIRAAPAHKTLSVEGFLATAVSSPRNRFTFAKNAAEVAAVIL